MLNNKGFAVSSILYILLASFLLFLGVCLFTLSSSSITMSKAVEDLVNGEELSVEEVVRTVDNTTDECSRLRINYMGKTFYYPDNKEISVGGKNITVTNNNKEYNVSVDNGPQKKIRIINDLCNN